MDASVKLVAAAKWVICWRCSAALTTAASWQGVCRDTTACARRQEARQVAPSPLLAAARGAGAGEGRVA